MFSKASAYAHISCLQCALVNNDDQYWYSYFCSVLFQIYFDYISSIYRHFAPIRLCSKIFLRTGMLLFILIIAKQHITFVLLNPYALPIACYHHYIRFAKNDIFLFYLTLNETSKVFFYKFRNIFK